MRIPLRQQLAILLVLSGAIGLAVLAIATWVSNHDFVLNITKSKLEVTASLKSAQVAYNLELMRIAATFIAARTSIQDAVARYNNGSDTSASNFNTAASNLEATLGNTGLLSTALILQTEVFAGNFSGPAGTSSVMNVTGPDFDSIKLPWLDANGSQSYLGESSNGYPAALYPNLTIYDEPDGTPHATYDGVHLGLQSTLVLGPINVNSSFALLSLTVPIVNNNSTETLIGWITVVTSGRLIREVFQDQRGLGDSGSTLLVGPHNRTNLFSPGIIGNASAAGDALVDYPIPLNDSARAQHPTHVAGTPNRPFLAGAFPAIRDAIIADVRGVNDVGSLIRTHNEANKQVAVGYSTAPTTLVDWIIVVEQDRSEVWEPINRLRTIILACFFGVVGFMCILSLPLAHWAVRPIMRLRNASAHTTATRSGSHNGSTESLSSHEKELAVDGATTSTSTAAGEEGFFSSIVSRIALIPSKLKAKRRADYHVERRQGTMSRIPGKVPVSRSWLKDEMYDLVITFNEMGDELSSQYNNLEGAVRQRTIELEHSKKAAEAANESKTLFVANVSHELRTPLNGILGLTAVCMEEEDAVQLKKSLGTIFKSGDLLLRTLTDLLTFSTNQVGNQALTLEEKDFVLRDLETQTMAIFGEQAKDSHVNLSVVFEDNAADLYGPSKLRDITVHADVHRILQVIINLVSNSLKFTPVGGAVTLTIKCLTETPTRQTSMRRGRRILQPQTGSSKSLDDGSEGTANFINPREVSEAHASAHEQTRSLPPGRDLLVQLQVKDTGPGVEEEMQTRIFEPFVQADAGLSRKHSGTGLGLSISSQLVSLMGGTIGLQSKLGDGCLFTVKLPLRQVHGCGTPSGTPRSSVSRPISRKASVNRMPTIPNGRTPDSECTLVGTLSSNGILTASPPERPDPPVKSPDPLPERPSPTRRANKDNPAVAQQDFSKAKVLVAEDNKVNQEVILRMLKLEKILNVTIAADGKEALDYVTQKDGDCSAYDLIFMDIQMPNMDGHCATRLIREAGFSKPIVALTAFADQSNIDECYGSGMDYFLSKPIKRPLLKKVLSEYCQPAAAAEESQDASPEEPTELEKDVKI